MGKTNEMKLKFNIPTTWNELTDNQLKKVAALFFSNLSGVVFDYLLFKILVGYRWYKFKLARKIAILFNNILTDDIKTLYLDFYQKQNLTRFIKSIRIGRYKFYAPANRLSNLTIGEFATCEDLFINFNNNIHNKGADHGIPYLQYLAAVLYVNSKTIRPEFTKTQLPDKVNIFQKAPKDFLLATALSYRGCKNYIQSLEKYRSIFPKPKENSNKESERKRITSAEIDKLIRSVAKKRTFGNYKETYNTNVFTFLDDYADELKLLPKNGTNAR